ncbi:hypothetical protein JK356_02995 [Streptomyces sp. 7-21]|nr:hypothetical protein [Streptomyces sp. 7-21]MBL1065649.1 hypothetical protein [Streptomyces sp. 7-21]
MTGLTAAALAVVAFFAYQASAAEDRPPAASGDQETPAGERGGSGGEGGQPETPALPPESGEGRRVVYSLEQDRVWLVDISEDGTGEVVTETYEVFPSAVDPAPGEYEVTSRTAEITGSDGVPVEHVVVFHVGDDGTVFGFSSALDGSVPDPESGPRTGGVRQSRDDGDAMWSFADVGVPVVVTP